MGALSIRAFRAAPALQLRFPRRRRRSLAPLRVSRVLCLLYLGFSAADHYSTVCPADATRRSPTRICRLLPRRPAGLWGLKGLKQFIIQYNLKFIYLKWLGLTNEGCSVHTLFGLHCDCRSFKFERSGISAIMACLDIPGAR